MKIQWNSIIPLYQPQGNRILSCGCYRACFTTGEYDCTVYTLCNGWSCWANQVQRPEDPWTQFLSWTGNLSFHLWPCFHCSLLLIILFIYGSMSVQAKTRYMAAQIVSFWPSFVMFWSTATGTFSPCQPLVPRLKNAKPGRSFEFSSQWLQCTGSLCIVVDCRLLYLWHQANWYFAFFDVSVILLAHNHL